MDLAADARDRRWWTLAVPVGFAIAYLVVFVLWQLVGRTTLGVSRWISDAAPIPAEVAAVATAWWASSRANSPRLRVAWMLVSAAFAAFLIGDAVWLLYEAVLGKAPFPSPADGFYLAFYAVLVAGLLSFPVARRSRIQRATLMFDFGTVFVAAAMGVWYLVIGPTLTEQAHDPLKVVLSLAYPVGDLVVLFGLFAVLARGITETPRRAVCCLLVGIGCFLTADIAFASLALHHQYESGDWPDTLWLAASLLVVVAAWPGRSVPTEPATLESRVPEARYTLLPYLSIVAVWGMLMFAARDEPLFPILGLLIGGLVLTVLVFARQLTAQSEVRELLARYGELANSDALTHVASRHRFFDLGATMARAAFERGEPVSVVMIDVDGLKTVNDEWGHTAGDDALRAIAVALRHQFGARALIGRFGGDEFVALITGRPGDEVAGAATAASSMPIPVQTRRGPSTIRVTAGAATAPSPDLDALIAAADAALYERRASNRHRTFRQAARHTTWTSKPGVR